MLIILLSFLIAIIGQSYDSVMSKTIISLYKSKCDFNKECTLLLDKLNDITGEEMQARIYMVSANIEHNDQKDIWNGIIKSIMNTVTTEINAVKKETMAFKLD